MKADTDLPLREQQLRSVLRGLVNATGPRHPIPTVLHLGTPGGTHLSFADDAAFDSGLRADILERALDGLDLQPAPIPWITRRGELSPGDLDFAWFGAAREAFGRHGLELPAFYVVTRRGWFDLLQDADAILVKVRRRTRRRT